MDPLANKEWTSSEVEQAMAIISKHNSHRIMYIDNDGNNWKHNNIMDDLLELFPSKTRQQVIDLYLGLAREMYMMQPREERHVDGGITHSVGTINLCNGNFGVPEESGSSSICGTYALGDLVNDKFVLQEEDMPSMDDNGLSFGCVLEDTMAIQAKETLSVVDKNKMEVLENNVSSYQPVVSPHQGRYWTTEEHRLFLHGLRVYGRGKWKSISKHFVTTRTHIQVSSHAQKYFKRLQKRATSGTQRYSINDVQLHDDHKSVADNSFAPLQALAFTSLNNGTSFGLQDPASSSMPMNNLTQQWSPFIYGQQVGQQAMWSEQQVMDPTAVVMDGTGNSTPSYEEGSTYFSLRNV